MRSRDPEANFRILILTMRTQLTAIFNVDTRENLCMIESRLVLM